jgi:hypothetical protein
MPENNVKDFARLYKAYKTYVKDKFMLLFTVAKK